MQQASLHVQSAQMQPIVTDVLRSICLLDTTMSCATADKPVEMPFRMWTLVGQRNHVFGGGSDLSRGSCIFVGWVPPCDMTFRQNFLTTCYVTGYWLHKADVMFVASFPQGLVDQDTAKSVGDDFSCFYISCLSFLQFFDTVGVGLVRGLLDWVSELCFYVPCATNQVMLKMFFPTGYLAWYLKTKYNITKANIYVNHKCTR